MDQMPSALSCTGLHCGYAGVTVLADVNLAVQPGGITALLGPNGSGKSTLLKTILGEIPAIAGSVEIAGRPATSLTARERAQQIAFVPSEERTEFPFLVREVVAMGRIPHSEGLFDSDDDKRITQDAMGKAECDHLADRPITNLSAGERQRVLIARALAQQSPLLLLDEPTSHLDPGHQVSFVQLVWQLAKSGLSFVVALHDLNLAAHLAQSAVVISDKRIVFSGAINDVLDSTTLDEAYETKFERIKGSDGIVRLSPMFASTA